MKLGQRIVALLLVILWAATSSAEEENARMARYRTMSIRDLLDEGGKPTGLWYMGGMPWPLSELGRRNHERVIDEALNVLDGKPKHDFSHAFAVYVLVNLRPTGLNKLLLDRIEKVDGPGLYEILLHAAQTDDAAFVPIFTEILDRQIDEPREVDLLAAEYVRHVPRQQFIPGLERLQKLLAKQVRSDDKQFGRDHSFILDGFPYSDLVSFSIEQPAAFVAESIELVRKETQK